MIFDDVVSFEYVSKINYLNHLHVKDANFKMFNVNALKNHFINMHYVVGVEALKIQVKLKI